MPMFRISNTRVSMRRIRMSSSTLISITPSSLRPLLLSIRSSASACGTVRGKPSRMKPRLASALVDPVGHDADHDVVGHQLAAGHDVARLHADRRAGGDRRPQHVAGRELHDAVTVDQRLRLRALAGPRRTKQHNPHLRFPRSLERLIKPSYW